MTWYVFIEDWNKKKIVPYDIFNSVSFRRHFLWIISQNFTYETFKKELKDSLLYCFAHKREYEIETIYNMINVYDQLMLNFDEFVEFCWRMAHND